MSAQSTLSFSDIYGPSVPGKKGTAERSDTEKASGTTGPVASANPVSFWLAMVGMLVVARILWERGR
jgi:hypothetical protein